MSGVELQTQAGPLAARIDAANELAVERLSRSALRWIDVRPAIEVLPGMTRETVLHAGPRIEWERMCGPQRNGVIDAMLYEGLAPDESTAERMVARGEIRIAPCHEFGAVGGMAGITSASSPVAVVLNETTGDYGYSQLFQGPRGRLVSRDDYRRESIRQWRWLDSVLGPTLSDAVRARGGLDVRNLTARALQMGDESHNRNSAATLLLTGALMPSLLDTCKDPARLRDCVQYLGEAEQFALSVSMAAGKALAQSIRNIEYSTVVSTLCRNGVDFGVRVAGLGDAWFVAPANRVEGLYFSSEWSDADAVADMGDSAIMETIGLGGHVQAAAPALQQFVHGSFSRAVAMSREMEQITLGRANDLQIPALDFAGAPLATDIRRVVATGITPIIDTAIAHAKGGVIGAGQTRAPLACFQQALQAFEQRYGSLS